jgi:hypothetical protein
MQAKKTFSGVFPYTSWLFLLQSNKILPDKRGIKENRTEQLLVALSFQAIWF